MKASSWNLVLLVDVIKRGSRRYCLGRIQALKSEGGGGGCGGFVGAGGLPEFGNGKCHAIHREIREVLIGQKTDILFISGLQPWTVSKVWDL